MLKISAASASVLGDLKESHISVWLCGEGGREEGSANERASRRNERRPQLVVGVGERARGRTREGGRNGLKNDTQLPLMFRLLSASQATPSDFFKTADGRTDVDARTATASNCDQSRFAVRLRLFLSLRCGEPEEWG